MAQPTFSLPEVFLSNMTKINGIDKDKITIEASKETLISKLYILFFNISRI